MDPQFYFAVGLNMVETALFYPPPPYQYPSVHFVQSYNYIGLPPSRGSSIDFPVLSHETSPERYSSVLVLLYRSSFFFHLNRRTIF